MPEQKPEEKESLEYRLAVAAARVVSRNYPRAPGKWDFISEFRDELALVRLEARISELEIVLSRDALLEGQRLYLMHRLVELKEGAEAARLRLGR